jgi:hypothetical protein
MTTISHPYKGKISRHEARVTFDVSEADFKFLFREILPLRNAPNAVMATMFKAFVTFLRRNPKQLHPYDTDNERIVGEYLQRLTFGQHHDNGSDHPCPGQWAALRTPAALTVSAIGNVSLSKSAASSKEISDPHLVSRYNRSGDTMSEDRPSRCFRFVQTYDEKPKRGLFELLKGQGMQMNQRVMFFSDGGTDIREVQQYLNPEAEHYLDWFHITMRLTAMGQYAKGLDTTLENRQEILKSLESVKHYLWHGNVARAS